jgi:hypothetical protein
MKSYLTIFKNKTIMIANNKKKNYYQSITI